MPEAATSLVGTSPPPRLRAQRRHFTGLVSEQSIYNLLTRDIELEVIPAAQANGLGLIAWSPLNGGLLGGGLGKQHERKRRVEDRLAKVLAAHRDSIEQYERLAADLGHEPGDVGLAWLLHQPAVTAPIVGPRTASQLDSAVRALSARLDAQALRRLDEIFPGKKTAPEEYAW